MREITVYRTYSYGGIEGRSIEKSTYETIEMAKAAAMNDTWNCDFILYEVVITFNGTVTEKETRIGEIPCGRDKKRIALCKEIIEDAKKAIEEHKANKRIKETTREKRIAEEKERIERMEKEIREIEERF